MATRDISYEYDAVGNRTKMTSVLGGATTTTTYTYDAANQLTSEINSFTGTTTYTYDDAGNLTEKDSPGGMTTYDYDARGLMVEADPGSPVTYTYNADGQRVRKETASETINYLYDFSRLLEQSDASHDPQTSYTSTEDEYGDLVSEYDQSGTPTSRYYTYDGLGSTDALVDPDGDVTDRYEYTAFGFRAHTQGSSETPFTFVGRQQYQRESEVDLYLLGGGNRAGGGRYYDPDVGRFLSKDRLEDDALANAYRYVGNNPVNATDPSGEERKDPCDLVFTSGLPEYSKLTGELQRAVPSMPCVDLSKSWNEEDAFSRRANREMQPQPNVEVIDTERVLKLRGHRSIIFETYDVYNQEFVDWCANRKRLEFVHAAAHDARCQRLVLKNAIYNVAKSIEDRQFDHYTLGYYRIESAQGNGPWTELKRDVPDSKLRAIQRSVTSSACKVVFKISDGRVEKAIEAARDELMIGLPVGGLSRARWPGRLTNEEIDTALADAPEVPWNQFGIPTTSEFQAAIAHQLDLHYNPPKSGVERFLDFFQLALDVLGTVPVVGILFDVANVVVSAARGNYGEAALSAAAALPFIGLAAGVGKVATKVGAAAVGAATAGVLIFSRALRAMNDAVMPLIRAMPAKFWKKEGGIWSVINEAFEFAADAGKKLKNKVAGGADEAAGGARAATPAPKPPPGFLDDAARADIWKMDPKARGRLIEDHLAVTEYEDWFRVGAEHGGTFPLIDFQKGTTVVSLKTADTASKTFISRMKTHIRDLGLRRIMVDDNVATKVLDLRVPPNGAMAAAELIQYGIDNGVEVLVREF